MVFILGCRTQKFYVCSVSIFQSDFQFQEMQRLKERKREIAEVAVLSMGSVLSRCVIALHAGPEGELRILSIIPESVTCNFTNRFHKVQRNEKNECLLTLCHHPIIDTFQMFWITYTKYIIATGY